MSEGFRPPRAACLTNEQWQLVCRCWDADPCARPPMAAVAGQLAAMMADARKERERSSKAQQVRRGGARDLGVRKGVAEWTRLRGRGIVLSTALGCFWV